MSVAADGSLRVTGRRAGSATLHVRANDEAGDDLEGEAEMSFTTPSGIFLARDLRPDGTALAAMVGASARWSIEIAVDGRQTTLGFDEDALEVESTGDALAVTRARGPVAPVGAFDVAFERAGTSHVRFSLGSHVATVDVRVASAADVVGFEVHDANSARFTSFVIEPEALSVLDPPSPEELARSEETGSRRTFASVLVLRDGTKALGGAGFFRLANGASGIRLRPHDGQSGVETRPAPDPLGAAFFDLHRDIDAPALAEGWTLTAALEGASGEWRVSAE